jgi:DNA processing protein
MLLTDFLSGTPPDKQNFPGRNRITAGLCDALVVVESGKQGGSLITADLAAGYHRDVFAFPGRTTDPKSEGCNELISGQKAQLISSAADLLDSMLWVKKESQATSIQAKLFQELNESEKAVVEIIRQLHEAPVDAISWRWGHAGSLLAGTLLSLEIKGLIKHHPGNIFTLI